LELQLTLKENDLQREKKLRLETKMKTEKDLQQMYELRAHVDTMKTTINTLQQDFKQLQDINSEQKVRF